MRGNYLGQHRTDDLDELESCMGCDGNGIVEQCDYCADREYDPYEAIGESRFGLPGGERSL